MADPIDALSGYPVLQWGLVVGTFVAGALAIWRGVVAKPHRTDDTQDLLKGIYNMLKEQRTDHARFADENNRKIDTETDVLRQIERHTDRARRP
jgi:hypothetical protein